MGSAAGQAGCHHALIFGASGINGWAVVNQMLLGYPDQSTFSKVTALTNRPLSLEVSQWPSSDKLNIVSGLDLLKGDQSELEQTLKAKVGNIETVSHVYFFAYIIDADPAKEVTINKDLLQRAISAIENLSPNLKFVVLPTGTKVGCSDMSSIVLLDPSETEHRRLTESTSCGTPSQTKTTYHSKSHFLGFQSPMPAKCSTTRSWTCSSQCLPTNPGRSAMSSPT